jgi:hypothetical protein
MIPFFTLFVPDLILVKVAVFLPDLGYSAFIKWGKERQLDELIPANISTI